MKKRFQLFKKRRGILVVVFFLCVTFIYAMFQGGFVSWFLFYLMLPPSIYSFLLFLYPISKVKVEKSIETHRVFGGGKFTVTVQVKRNNRFPLMYTTLEEKVSNGLREAITWKHVIFWGMKKEYKWTYELEKISRGEHELEGTIIHVSDLFGWVRKEVFIPNKKTILVFPNVTEMVFIPIESRYDQGAAVSRMQTMKDTSMATGIRSYQPGDRVSWIHWKSFARTQTLKTKEFEDRQSQDLYVLMDREPSDFFEEIVDLTASIMQAIVKRQASSAFLSYGKTRFFIPAVQNEEQLHQLMYHLTKVQADSVKPTEQVIWEEPSISKVTSLLYITSGLSYEWIDSIRKNASNLRVCTCFVVKEKEKRLTRDEIALHKYAASRGVHINVITKDRFAEAFLELNRS